MFCKVGLIYFKEQNVEAAVGSLYRSPGRKLRCGQEQPARAAAVHRIQPDSKSQLFIKRVCVTQSKVVAKI